jgi:hypothetical protein
MNIRKIVLFVRPWLYLIIFKEFPLHFLLLWKTRDWKLYEFSFKNLKREEFCNCILPLITPKNPSDDNYKPDELLSKNCTSYIKW